MVISECNKDDISFLNENLIKHNASMVPFTQDEPYYVHLQYREGDTKEYGESLKLNFIKD